MDKTQTAELIRLMEKQTAALERLSCTIEYLVSIMETTCAGYGKPRPPMQPDDDFIPF
jgi:hypothetical protein